MLRSVFDETQTQKNREFGMLRSDSMKFDSIRFDRIKVRRNFGRLTVF